MKSRRVFLFSTIISVCLCTVMTTPAFAVNWWQVGWIVANNVIDRVVNLDGQSSNDQYSTYMVSPSIVFNNGTNGGEFYMRPQVSSRVTSFEMHAHRANPVDFGANIVLALSTTSGKRVINKTVGTNQYVSYTRSSSDGTTFRYNANPDQPRTTKAPTLDIKQLNNQFYDEKVVYQSIIFATTIQEMILFLKIS